MIKTLIPDLFLVLAVFLVSAALGMKLFRLAGFRFNTGFEYALFSLAAGLQSVSCITLMFTLFNYIHGYVFACIFLLIAVLCFPEIKQLLSIAGKVKPVIARFQTSSKFELVLCGITAAAAISNFLFNYAPPSQVREMMGDLSVPKLYVSNFVLDKQYLDYYSYHYFYYLHFQMIYTVLMAFFSHGISFKLFNYFIGILNLLLVYKLTVRISDKKTGILAGTIFYLMPLVTQNSGTANIEFGLVFYGLLSLWAVYNWSITREYKWFYVSALMSGFCFTVKMPGFATMIAVFIAAVYIMACVFREPAGLIVRKLVLFCILCFIAFSPWVIRSYVLTGNPMYPFSVLNLKGSDDLLLEKKLFDVSREQFSLADNLKSHLRFYSGDVDQSAGPLVFTFLFISLLLVKRFDSNRQKLLVFAVLHFFCLYFILPLPYLRFEFRYYLLSYTLFSVIAAFTINELKKNPGITVKVINSAVIGGLLFPCLFMSLFFGLKRLPVMFNINFDRSGYIQHKLPEYKFIEHSNSILPESSKIVVVHFILNAQYYWNSRVYKIPLKMMYKDTPKQIIDGLKNNGMTHVYFSLNPDSFNGRFNIHFFNGFSKYCSKNLELVYMKDDIYLYKI